MLPHLWQLRLFAHAEAIYPISHLHLTTPQRGWIAPEIQHMQKHPYPPLYLAAREMLTDKLLLNWAATLETAVILVVETEMDYDD